MALANSAETGQNGSQDERMQTSTHNWRHDNNHACAIFLEKLAKNVLAFNFRKLEALEGKIKEIESRKTKLPAISFREQNVGFISSLLTVSCR